MLRKIVFISILSFTSVALFAQDDVQSDSTAKEKSYTPLILNFKPTLGLGAGMLTYYGDIGSGNRYSPLVSRVGYDISVSNPITDFLSVSFYVMFGKLADSERSLERNLNFESSITVGGAVLNYNFNHLLPADRIVEPMVFVGFETVEFLSKTDLYDGEGNMYHYWSDGSIKDMAEGSSGSQFANDINRDYVYESDIRTLDLDDFGKYAERTWAMPVGIGANFHISDHISFYVKSAMHFTFSNYIDGVTEESIGSREGNSKNDNFLFTSFGVSYDFMIIKPEDKMTPEELEELLLAGDYDMEDQDGDGIQDFIDECPNTPAGTEVNHRGCPTDTDGDLIPDFRDDEINTSPELVNQVDEKGVGITDEELEELYLVYIDSLGIYGSGYEDSISDSYETEGTSFTATDIPQDLKYVILIGDGSQEVSPSDLSKLLSYKNFKTYQKDGTIFYVLEGYETEEDALKDQYKLENDDLEAIAQLAKETNDGTGSSSYEPIQKDDTKPNVEISELPVSNEVILRVQIGAFSKKVSEEAFNGVPNLIAVQGSDGLYRYYSGTFDDKTAAANHKINMVDLGFTGSFIVAYQGGKRISLNDAGFAVVPGAKDPVEDDATTNSIDKSKVKYRIQVGAFQNEVPEDVLNTFLQLEDVTPVKGKDSMIRYVFGKFNSRAEAEAELSKVQEKIGEAFIVGEFNGAIISATEADELIEE